MFLYLWALLQMEFRLPLKLAGLAQTANLFRNYWTGCMSPPPKPQGSQPHSGKTAKSHPSHEVGQGRRLLTQEGWFCHLLLRSFKAPAQLFAVALQDFDPPLHGGAVDGPSFVLPIGEIVQIKVGVVASLQGVGLQASNDLGPVESSTPCRRILGEGKERNMRREGRRTGEGLARYREMGNGSLTRLCLA